MSALRESAIAHTHPLHESGASRRHWWLVAILVLAVALRLAYSLGLQRGLNHILPEHENTDGYHLIAENWYAGSGYTFRAGGPATMQRPPAYPAFLVMMFNVAGVNYLWVQVAQALLGALACGLLFLLGRWICSTELGLVAALLFAIYPNAIVYASRLYSENLYFPVFIAFAYVLCRATLQASARLGALAGALWALSLLTRGTLFLLPLALPVVIHCSPMHRQSLVRVTRWGLPALGAAILTLTPWALRNYSLSGSVVPVSSWGWAPMFAGAQISQHMGNWSADLTLIDNGAIDALRDLNERANQNRGATRPLDGPHQELASEQVAKAAVLAEWRSQPLARAGRAVAGIAYTWFLSFDPPTRKMSLLLHGCLFVLFAAGCVLLLSRDPAAFWRAWPALGTILFVNLFQAAAFPHVRYMSPAIALSFVFAAVPILTALHSARARNT